MEREMYYADKFYPKNSELLIKFFNQFCKVKEIKNTNSNFGLILPHAGYVYSGKTALYAICKALDFGKPERIIIFGTNHTGIAGNICSLWPRGKWNTPFGYVGIDEELNNYLLKNEIFEENYKAHILEHSIEVLLPILKYYFGSFKFVPIIYNYQSYENTIKIVELLKKIDLKNTLLVASSDFNHYESHEITLRKDEKLIEKILERDIEGIYSLRKSISACGIGPMSVLTMYFDNVKLVYHTTSAEYSKDYTFTVGYASFVLW